MKQPLTPDSQYKLKQFFQLALQHGCPKDQILNFSNAGIILQARQLAASAAARLCDQPARGQFGFLRGSAWKK